MTSTARLLLLAPLLLGALQGGADPALAPDGRPGFGTELDLGAMLQRFRTPSEEERALIAELETVARDVGVLVDVTAGQYRDRGYFELLEPLEEPTLARLHETFDRYLADPASVATRTRRIGRAFARMFLDTRFRVRKELIETWEYEASEVADGLAVLRGAAHGYVLLDGVQVGNIARRLDLAGATLRALRRDLESLREAPGVDERTAVTEEVVDEFLGMFDLGDRSEREARVTAALEGAARDDERMRSVLFTDRLRWEARALFEWRAHADSRANELYREAFAAVPDREGADDVPREVAKLSKTRRRKLAREKAIEGLASDPLDEELAWIAGRMSDLVYGELETASHYDRFLVLRRIYYYTDSTYSERELDQRERAALQFVQEIDRRTTVPTGG